MITRADGLLHSRLAVDATLISLCTGGIHLATDFGMKGLTKDTVPSAYDTKLKLKPTLTVKGRDVNKRGDAPYDPDEQYMIGVQVVEVFIQADQTVRSTTLDPIVNRVFALLHEKPTGPLARLELMRDWSPYYDEGMGFAMTRRMEFLVESE